MGSETPACAIASVGTTAVPARTRNAGILLERCFETEENSRTHTDKFPSMGSLRNYLRLNRLDQSRWSALPIVGHVSPTAPRPFCLGETVGWGRGEVNYN